MANAVGNRIAPNRTFSANREFGLEVVAGHPGYNGVAAMRAHPATTGMAGRSDAHHVVIGDTAMKVPGAIHAWCRALERVSLVAGEQLRPWAP